MILPAVAAAWFLAIGLHALGPLPWWFGGALLVLAAPQVGVRKGVTFGAGVAVVGALIWFGAWRFHEWASVPEPAWSSLAGSDVIVEGTIDGAPDPGNQTVQYRVRVDRLFIGDAEIAGGGSLLAGLPQYTELRRGTAVRFEGELENLDDDQSGYSDYLRREGISGIVPFADDLEVLSTPGWSFGSALDELRLDLQRGLERVLPEPEASLAAGIAFGRDQSLSRETNEQFRRSGLAHLIAVSGSNVAIIAAACYLITLRFLGRRTSAVVVVVLVGAYVLLAGAEWPVVRAGAMALVLLGGWFTGRPQAGLAGLALAAIAITAWQPGAVASASFQLSVVATAGILMLGGWARWAAHWPRRNPWLRVVYPRRVADVIAITGAATVAVTPLSAALFGQVSLVGLAANVLAEPVFVAALPVSLATAIFAAVFEPAGLVVALGAYYPLRALTWLAAWSSSMPFAAVDIDLNSRQLAAVYMLLVPVALMLYLRPNPEWARLGRAPKSAAIVRRMAIAGAAAGVAVAVTRVSVLPYAGPGELVVTVLDIGQGDAILVTTPGGESMLVDGGPSGLELARELGLTLPHWQRHLSAVFLTHGDSDHAGGLAEVLRRYDAAAVYDNGSAGASPSYFAFQARTDPRRTLVAGDSFELDGVTIDVLWPDAAFESTSPNELSLVLRVSYRNVDFLLTGDVQGDALSQLLDREIEADVLKVPHHGSRTTDPEFFAAVRSALAVISVGATNPYGHPHEQTLDALAGIPTLRTDTDGRVTIRTDGKAISVDTER